MGIALQTGIAATAVSDVGTLIAPTSGIAAVLYGAYLIVRLYREGRSEQVQAARARAMQAEARANEAERESRADITLLKTQVSALETELKHVRAEMASQRRAHDKQIRDAYRRLETEIRVAHRLTEWCIEHGIGLPPDLDPAHPELPPQLGMGDSPQATSVRVTWRNPDWEPAEDPNDPNPEGPP